jgi:hypothetical protein
MLGGGEAGGKETGAAVSLWVAGGDNEPTAQNEKSGAVNQKTPREATTETPSLILSSSGISLRFDWMGRSDHYRAEVVAFATPHVSQRSTVQVKELTRRVHGMLRGTRCAFPQQIFIVNKWAWGGVVAESGHNGYELPLQTARVPALDFTLVTVSDADIAYCRPLFCV